MGALVRLLAEPDGSQQYISWDHVSGIALRWIEDAGHFLMMLSTADGREHGACPAISTDAAYPVMRGIDRCVRQLSQQQGFVDIEAVVMILSQETEVAS